MRTAADRKYAAAAARRRRKIAKSDFIAISHQADGALARSISGGCRMRLDKYLKVSRLIKRRTVANEACDAGRVSVNGRTAKASVDVKPGDVIEIGFGTRNVKVEVVSVAETSKKDEAKELFKYL